MQEFNCNNKDNYKGSDPLAFTNGRENMPEELHYV